MNTLIVARIIYFLGLIFITIIYQILINSLKKDYKKYMEDWEKIRQANIKLVRRIDLTEQYGMLLELHEIQENYPNVSRHDTTMMNTINEYIEKTARQLRYLDNKNESSELGDNIPDNSK